MDNRKVSGHLLLGVTRYVQEQLTEAERLRVQERVPHILGRGVSLERSAWYPLTHIVELCAAVDSLEREAESSFTSLCRAGECIAGDGASTYLRLLLKVLTPKLFIRQFPALWRRYHDFGELSVDSRRIHENYAIIHMPSYEYVSALATGWIHFAFQQLSVHVDVETNYPWRGDVPERLEVRFAWH
jgi:hypothetical protein